ncbi:unnamed protein product [Pieris macdunnoughi]|uniref:Uncharacterized protein n=1 Tax=Pieris macdunnoughi TaxID=345717 RepID=A0A821LAE8_9NEOP|nr:unnamed protein product [Pieris macdunnoughi]
MRELPLLDDPLEPLLDEKPFKLIEDSMSEGISESLTWLESEASRQTGSRARCARSIRRRRPVSSGSKGVPDAPGCVYASEGESDADSECSGRVHAFHPPAQLTCARPSAPTIFLATQSRRGTGAPVSIPTRRYTRSTPQKKRRIRTITPTRELLLSCNCDENSLTITK